VKLRKLVGKAREQIDPPPRVTLVEEEGSDPGGSEARADKLEQLLHPKRKSEDDMNDVEIPKTPEAL